MDLRYTITMTPDEKEKYKQIAVSTKVLLVTIVDGIEDNEERSKMWGKIRDYNKLLEIFIS